MKLIADLFANEVFFAGFIGAFAAELIAWFVTLSAWMRNPPKTNPTPVPGGHVPRGIWLIYLGLTVLVSFVGGKVAAYYAPTHLIGAFHIGASIPLFIKHGAAKLPRIKS